MAPAPQAPVALKRKLGLGLLTAYGVGVMVGAGIYVLVGVAAGTAGVWAPLSFLLAALVAIPSALSFAELSARIPEASGDSAYVEAGLGLHGLAVLVGLINILAGTVAAAAVLRGGVGYLLVLVDLPQSLAILGLGLMLCAIAVIGVVESLAFAAVMTVIEVAGLLLVVWAGFSAPATPDWIAPPPLLWSGVIAATVFAFFAFVGFDDIVNMAEEAKAPERNMPRAILISLAITAALYAAVSAAAVRAVPMAELAASSRPLALVWQAATGGNPAFLAAIAVAAALNGILAQMVMASRVLFGLGRRSPWAAVFTHAHPRFGTPVRATLLIGAAVIAAALSLPVETLAEVTSALLLIVFIIVNAALIGLKRKAPDSPFRIPVWVPWTGVITALLALAATMEALP